MLFYQNIHQTERDTKWLRSSFETDRRKETISKDEYITIMVDLASLLENTERRIDPNAWTSICTGLSIDSTGADERVN